MSSTRKASEPVTKSQRYLEAHGQILSLMVSLGAGTRLPSEETLAGQLAFSRNTIRDALTKLEREGAVIRRHGLGTFVAPQAVRLNAPINTVAPIHELILAAGFEPRVRSQHVERKLAATEASEVFACAKSTLLLTVSLLHLAGSTPAVSISYQLNPSLELEGLDFSAFDGQMIALLERNRTVRVHQTRVRIAAVLATPALAQSLEVAVNSALLEFISIAYSTTGQALYRSVSYQDSRLLEVNVVRHRN